MKDFRSILQNQDHAWEPGRMSCLSRIMLMARRFSPGVPGLGRKGDDQVVPVCACAEARREIMGQYLGYHWGKGLASCMLTTASMFLPAGNSSIGAYSSLIPSFWPMRGSLIIPAKPMSPSWPPAGMRTSSGRRSTPACGSAGGGAVHGQYLDPIAGLSAKYGIYIPMNRHAHSNPAISETVHPGRAIPMTRTWSSPGRRCRPWPGGMGKSWVC